MTLSRRTRSFRSRLVCAALAAAVGLGLGGCGDDKKVGDESLLDFKEEADKQRLGQTTTSTTAAPVATSAAPGKAGIGQPTSTTATAKQVATTTTTAPKVTMLEVGINGDKSGAPLFDPGGARIVKGTVVRWTNKDSKPHSVEADNGEFGSGDLAPGQSYTWKSDIAGKINYHDGTRPYAVASVEVVER